MKTQPGFQTEFKLYHIKSDIYLHKELNLFVISSIYLVFSLSEIQRRLVQAQVYYTFFHFFWKETTHKSLKVADVRTICSSVHIIGIQLAPINVFYSVRELKNIIFHKSWSLLWRFLNSHVVGFFEASPYFIRYLHNNSTMLPN